LPRYRKHLEEIGRMFGIPEIGDSLLHRGFKGMVALLTEMIAVGHASTRELLASDGTGQDSNGPAG
jgi:hypothetical protein